MFRRKVYESLQRWATRRGQTALLVTGARQIGKSYLVERLGREKYQRLLTVNLYLDKAAKRSLAEASNVADLITRLSLMADQPLVPGETLIFIDEIQELPDLMTMVKGLVQDGSVMLNESSSSERFLRPRASGRHAVTYQGR